MQSALTDAACSHCYSLLSLLQSALTAAACSHCCSLLSLLQSALTAAVCSLCCSLLSLLQSALSAAVCSHCCSLLSLLQSALTAAVCSHQLDVTGIDISLSLVPRIDTLLCCKKASYYIVQYPILRIVQSALDFTPRQTCSTENHLSFSGKHSAMQQLIRKDYLYTYIHHCSQVLIHTAE